MIKVCGTGNDFLVVNHLQTPAEPLPSGEEISRLCHRHQGFGADGLVVLKPHSQYAFEWVFFNSDGSPAEMCGNAARAVSRYYAALTKKAQFDFLTHKGAVHASVENPGDLSGDVLVKLPLWSKYESGKSFPGGNFDFVNSGVPHAVLSVERLTDLEALKKTALQIKALPEFAKSGVNVTFKAPSLEAGKIHSVTFERGVENFTLACGTGAIAAAVAESKAVTPFELIVQVPGGVLWVSSHGKDVLLKGEGRIIGECRPGVFHEP